MDLTEAEHIRTGGKNTQKNYKKKKSSQPRQSLWYEHSPRARHLEY